MSGRRTFGVRADAMFVTALLILLAALLVRAPIRQLPDYHAFADARVLLGIPNFWNVITNLPLMLVGFLGVRAARTDAAAAKPAWLLCFAAVALAGFGSSYYHLMPNDAALVWDRLPIGIAFIAFFSALVTENINQAAGRRLLVPGLLFMLGSVFWWRATGDLSPWVFVQAGPLLAIVLVLLLYPDPHAQHRYLAYAFAWYVLGKLCELGDREVMSWTGGLMSGHALKHVASAAGAYCFYAMLKARVRS